MAGEESLCAYRVRLDVAVITTYIFGALLVPLKIWCKTQTRTGFHNVGWDDALSVFALFWTSASFLTVMLGLRPDLGRHTTVDVPAEELSYFLKAMVAYSLTYVFAVTFIKLAILGLYWKLFSVASRIPIAITALLVCAWFLTGFCLTVFYCVPIRAQWDLSVKNARCLNTKALYLGGSLSNLTLDFIVILVPLPYIWHLITSIRLRIAVAAIFALSFFDCIIPVIRLINLMSLPADERDMTFVLKDFILWTAVEVNIGLVCSCLPSLRPITRLVCLRRLFSTRSASSTPPALPGNNGHRLSQFSRIEGSRFTSYMAGDSELNGEEDMQTIDYAHLHNGF